MDIADAILIMHIACKIFINDFRFWAKLNDPPYHAVFFHVDGTTTTTTTTPSAKHKQLLPLILPYSSSRLCFSENKEFMDKVTVFILPCSSTVLLLKLVEGHGA
ncbi:hypothetical protein VNO80_23937 [Phaseolus coccineus]|uniref:Uncharacterized protein n=1 Tax=Phaseolus coccineus TaxID=3886 RepID=A0AAN9QRV6_PHACN